MKRLIVYLNSLHIGELEEGAGGQLRFRYSSDWLDNPHAIPLSRSLPLKNSIFDGGEVRSYFAGTLPDEGPRRIIAEVLGISSANDFAMLERIGGECAGAVSLLPEGMHLCDPSESRLRRLSENDLEEVINSLHKHPLMAGEEGLRLSLAGAQDKLPVLLDGTAVCLPLDNTPSTHIIKPEPERFPGLVANEFFCMKLADQVGLNVPEVFQRKVGSRDCLIVKRYDRIIKDTGQIERVHQEDFCQALGYPPEKKYQQEGGPYVRKCIALLREWSSAPVLDIRDFVDAMIFNVIIGNADAHGKNYSFLYSLNSRRLAPFYDLVCTLAWPQLSKIISMKIGSGKNLNEIRLHHFRKMAEECRLGWPMVRERVMMMSDKVCSSLSAMEFTDAVAHAEMTERISEIIQNRTRVLSEQ